MKVEIIKENNYVDLKQEINRWIENNWVKIIDIKFCINNSYCYAMIIYKEAKY